MAFVLLGVEEAKIKIDFFVDSEFLLVVVCWSFLGVEGVEGFDFWGGWGKKGRGETPGGKGSDMKLHYETLVIVSVCVPNGRDVGGC